MTIINLQGKATRIIDVANQRNRTRSFTKIDNNISNLDRSVRSTEPTIAFSETDTHDDDDNSTIASYASTSRSCNRQHQHRNEGRESLQMVLEHQSAKRHSASDIKIHEVDKRVLDLKLQQCEGEIELLKSLIKTLQDENKKNDDEISYLTDHTRCLEDEKHQLTAHMADYYTLVDVHEQVANENQDIMKKFIDTKCTLAQYKSRDDFKNQRISQLTAENDKLIKKLRKLGHIDANHPDTANSLKTKILSQVPSFKGLNIWGTDKTRNDFSAPSQGDENPRLPSLFEKTSNELTFFVEGSDPDDTSYQDNLPGINSNQPKDVEPKLVPSMVSFENTGETDKGELICEKEHDYALTEKVQPRQSFSNVIRGNTHIVKSISMALQGFNINEEDYENEMEDVTMEQEGKDISIPASPKEERAINEKIKIPKTVNWENRVLFRRKSSFV